ncbi:MAG: hypothetical protein J5725_10150 [Bacteroidales bacterium]|nr:hypothetical protein [Bacteroidales bacterium]
MMEKDVILALVAAVFGSTGLWTLVSTIWQHRSKKISTEGKMLRGLAHDRICELGSRYLKQGYITKDQYENLHDYLFIPYHDLGGNGTAEKITEDVKRLPIKEVANETNIQ